MIILKSDFCLHKKNILFTQILENVYTNMNKSGKGQVAACPFRFSNTLLSFDIIILTNNKRKNNH